MKVYQQMRKMYAEVEALTSRGCIAPTAIPVSTTSAIATSSSSGLETEENGSIYCVNHSTENHADFESELDMDANVHHINTPTSLAGHHTPDELAMVEMHFRLSSLRQVLSDLRGLLHDLVEFPASPDSTPSTQPCDRHEDKPRSSEKLVRRILELYKYFCCPRFFNDCSCFCSIILPLPIH
ncbi:unnamed protein product [Protopolystoma xenopodis]|uniref:Uncharacterized protein n=1 Tax=Protopolystoma xenopodis TaxID=117903 RepID=A0A3S5FFD2_9PLAT|nr:unnamed protein product [Protopolystoma xenopodis]